MKSKFFKKATIPPEKREILDNYKTEPNRSNRENRKQIQRKINAKRPTFEYTKGNIPTTIQPLQQQLITQKLINRNETRLLRNKLALSIEKIGIDKLQSTKIEILKKTQNGDFLDKDITQIIYNGSIKIDYTREIQSLLFSKGYAGGEGILKDLIVKVNDKIETYKQISKQIEDEEDEIIAKNILNIAGIHPKYKLSKNKSSTEIALSPAKIALSEYLYMLLLTVEPSRSPAALINNIQILELIAYNKMTFKEAFVGEKNAPMMPMAAPKIVRTSTTLQRKYVYNDNFVYVYPCHYLPHTTFGINQFGNKRECYSVKDDQLTDLQQKESNILDKWLKMKIGQYLTKNNEQVEEDNHIVNEELVDKIFEQINSNKDKSNYIDIVVEEIEATMRKYGLGMQGLEVGREIKLKQIVKNMNKQSQSKKQIKV